MNKKKLILTSFIPLIISSSIIAVACSTIIKDNTPPDEIKRFDLSKIPSEIIAKDEFKELTKLKEKLESITADKPNQFLDLLDEKSKLEIENNLHEDFVISDFAYLENSSKNKTITVSLTFSNGETSKIKRVEFKDLKVVLKEIPEVISPHILLNEVAYQWYLKNHKKVIQVQKSFENISVNDVIEISNDDLLEPFEIPESFELIIQVINDSKLKIQGSLEAQLILKSGGTYFDDSYQIYNRLKDVKIGSILVTGFKKEDDKLEQENVYVQQLFKQFAFQHKENQKHTYRIPSIAKYQDKLYLQVDGRIDNKEDTPLNRIVQSLKTFDLKTQQFSNAKDILSVRTDTKERITLIDSNLTIDEENDVAHLIVDAFPSDAGYIGMSKSTFNQDMNLSGIYNSGNLKLLDRVKDEFIEFKISERNSNWYQGYNYKTKEKTNVVINLEVKNNKFIFDVYEMKNANSNLNNVNEMKLIQSAFELFKNYENGKYERSKYKVIPQTFLSYLTIDLKTNEITFHRFLNDDLIKEKRTSIDLVSPGNGIILRHQKNAEDNGKLVFANYRINVLRRSLGAYFMMKDRHGEWTHSNFIAGGESNFTETTVVEQQDGTLVFIARNTMNKLAIGYSYDGGKTFTNKAGNKDKMDLYSNVDLLSSVLHGIEYFKYKGDDYLLLSGPSKQGGRREGKLFLVKNNDFRNAKEIYRFNRKNDKFEYSSLELIDIDDEGVKIATLYETQTDENKNKDVVEIVLEILKVKIY
ncbi:sialidase family protein [Mycoplasmopsis agassizii]|uniref:sialidase family protein n=1 Tax=Mycoplasmopsis agassizii TaxID=33922 RepID=UPI00352729BD